ncbi:transglycosylase domain-containing protein [Woodsholea maritima]|uniref:transglycosylase domain-containing protein n=1 Tax=Woodsholea maritima TaxID=240237 RepID=UPI00037B4C69|nr:PBP1A family penicillin-binding protein [Woodsholea maritima]
MTTYRADQKQKWMKIAQKAFWPSLIGGGVSLLIVLVIGGALFWRWAFNDMPDVPEDIAVLWDVRREETLTVLDKNGDVLIQRGPLYGSIVRLEALPDYIPNAFVAIEDERYYKHGGVDYHGLTRAMLRNITSGHLVEGGSTITMQTVKNLILTPERSLRRKLQELRLAGALEARLTKDQVLELYLNRIYFGAQAYGIEAAAQRYFSKPASELSVAEAALLAALPKAPSRLAPTTNLAAAQARAALVLDAMRAQNFIDDITYIEARTNPAAPVQSAGGDFDTAIFGYIFDQVALDAQTLLGEDTIAPDLVIHTTIDPDLQIAAHEVITAAIAEQGEARNISQAALLALSPHGAVRAMVGGTDYADSQFNRATQAMRQPGSAFKPIVFAAAFEDGYDATSVFEDEPIDLEGWTPENFGGSYRGQITLEDALKRSINTVAAQIGAKVGPQTLVQMARRLGITTEMEAVPSIALGAVEVRLIDLTNVYNTIAQDGRRYQPYLITRIENSRGRVLFEREETESAAAVYEQRYARELSTMMQAVVRDGTGRRAQLGNRAVAGKTGTSQNSRDAWFVGYTQHLTAGVWTGNDDDTPTNNVTGGNIPAQIWHDFMVRAHEGVASEPLNAPAPRRRGEREERLAAFYSNLAETFARLHDGEQSQD